MDKNYSAKKIMTEFSKYLFEVFPADNGYEINSTFDNLRGLLIGDFKIKFDSGIISGESLTKHVKTFYKEKNFGDEYKDKELLFKVSENKAHNVVVTGSDGDISPEAMISFSEIDF